MFEFDSSSTTEPFRLLRRPAAEQAPRRIIIIIIIIRCAFVSIKTSCSRLAKLSLNNY